MKRQSRRSEVGSATVVVCAGAGLAAALALGVARLAVASVAVARAETAADAAALAAARELTMGGREPEAARMAKTAAMANGARLLHCDCRGPGATVSVAVDSPRTGLFSLPVRARARAELHPECPG
jgi:secretion/DNA translocation related TadE-like protein